LPDEGIKDMPLNCQVITIDSMNTSKASRDLSKKSFISLVKSSEDVGNQFEPQIFSATCPEQVPAQMAQLQLQWNYPWKDPVTDLATGLKKTPYPTQFANNRIACALSHYRLWIKCYAERTPMLIMEHDAYFTQRFKGHYSILDDTRYDIVGINTPLGNTRKAQVFHQKVFKAQDPTHSPDKLDIVPVPAIDNFDVPQGLAGNSAYIIKPNGAMHLIAAVKRYGLWPNDAIMCKQLVPRMGVTKMYFTDCNHDLKSTTSQ